MNARQFAIREAGLTLYSTGRYATRAEAERAAREQLLRQQQKPTNPPALNDTD